MMRSLPGLMVATLMLAGSHAVAAGPVTPLKLIGHIPGPDGSWDYSTVDSYAHRLYVAHGDGVMAVDLDTGKVTPRLVPGSEVAGIALIRGMKLAISANRANNTATVFETATGKVVANVPSGGKEPDAVIQDPVTGLILIANQRSGDVALLNVGTLSLAGLIPVGGALEGMVVDGKGRAYVNVEDKNEVAVIDIAQRKTSRRIRLEGCDGPTGLSYDPVTDVLVAACGNQVARAVHAATGTEVATLKIGSHPDGVMFDPTRKLFYVSNGEGTLTAILERSASELQVVGSIPTAVRARIGTLDPATGRVYLPVAQSWLLPGMMGTLTLKHGTFQILVFGRD